MASDTAGALKAFIESQGLSLAVYHDQAPDDQTLPYVVILDDLAFVPDKLEDGAVSTGVETVQIDLWQQWRDPTTNNKVESKLLPRQLVRALQGSHLLTSGTGQPPTTVYALLVRNMIRMPELDENKVHHAITAEVFQTI